MPDASLATGALRCLAAMIRNASRSMSTPLFAMQHKVIISKILGVNAPELETCIVDNVPAIEAE